MCPSHCLLVEVRQRCVRGARVRPRGTPGAAKGGHPRQARKRASHGARRPPERRRCTQASSTSQVPQLARTWACPGALGAPPGDWRVGQSASPDGRSPLSPHRALRPSSPTDWVPAARLCGGEGVVRRMRRGAGVGTRQGRDRAPKPGQAPAARGTHMVQPFRRGSHRLNQAGGAGSQSTTASCGASRGQQAQGRQDTRHTHVKTAHLHAALGDAHHPVHPVAVVQTGGQRVAQL